MKNLPLELNTVLMVDDDPILSAIVEAFFKKRNVGEIYCAPNGRAALDFVDAASKPIDLVLCDLDMPELDGIQLLRHLKNRDFRGFVAIVSGSQDSVVRMAENLAEAHDLHLVGTLSKPVNLNMLEALVTGLSAPSASDRSAEPVLATANDLRNALVSGNVAPYFQPKVEIATGKVTGAEALARWTHPRLGVIGPDFFLPLAEQNDLMSSLTERMIVATVNAMVAWRERDVELKVSINLSSETLNRIVFPDEIAALCESAEIDCAQIVFEITERQIVENNANSSEVLARLRLMGIGVSIDDFGTGYSNITQLRQFPFSELKIDQSFIRGATSDKFSRASVEASVNLGKQLSLRLVAEGVETQEQWDYVTTIGIDEVQGYYVARPMPADAFADWVLDYEGRPGAQRAKASNPGLTSAG